MDLGVSILPPAAAAAAVRARVLLHDDVGAGVGDGRSRAKVEARGDAFGGDFCRGLRLDGGAGYFSPADPAGELEGVGAVGGDADAGPDDGEGRFDGGDSNEEREAEPEARGVDGSRSSRGGRGGQEGG